MIQEWQQLTSFMNKSCTPRAKIACHHQKSRRPKGTYNSHTTTSHATAANSGIRCIMNSKKCDQQTFHNKNNSSANASANCSFNSRNNSLGTVCSSREQQSRVPLVVSNEKSSKVNKICVLFRETHHRLHVKLSKSQVGTRLTLTAA